MKRHVCQVAIMSESHIYKCIGKHYGYSDITGPNLGGTTVIAWGLVKISNLSEPQFILSMEVIKLTSKTVSEEQINLCPMPIVL